MAVVTQDILLLTQAGIKTEFDAAYVKANANPDWMAVATELPTNLPIQKYAWLGRTALMKQFNDEAEGQSLNEQTYTLADILYKAKLDIERKSLEDDQYMLLMSRVRGLAQEAVRHWNRLSYRGLALGFTSLCYDGQYFFDTDHSEGDSGTQVNKTTSALSDAALEAAHVAMSAYVDDKGEPMEVVPDTLVVGPKNERVAWNLVGQPTKVTNVGDGTASSGATASTSYANFFYGKYRTVVSPYLIGTYDDYWFLLDTKREIKPIVIQSRSDVPITFETDMDLATAKIKEVYQATVRGRYAQGYGLWQLAYGGIL